MTGTQRAALPAVSSVASLGGLGANLAVNNGESRRVCLVPNFPGWIYKEYRVPLSQADAARLDRLIGLPASMGQSDRALAVSCASWPGCRVVDGQRSVGVLMPLAPDSYKAELRVPSGKTVTKMLEVDMLVQLESDQAKRNLPPQSLADRIMVCASLARVGALFERHGLVYLDWSYANVFWCWRDHSAYVIDMDGCSFGPRDQIQTHNWDDPKVPRGRKAGNESDRYRLALLTGRCLTAERGDPVAVHEALRGLRLHSEPVERIVELLIRTLSAASVAERPPVAAISAALDLAGGNSANSGSSTAAGGVTGCRPVNRPGATGTGTRPRPSPGTPSSRKATATPDILTSLTGSRVPAPATIRPAGAATAPTVGDSRTGTAATVSPRSRPAKPSSSVSTVVGWLAFLVVVAIILAIVI